MEGFLGMEAAEDMIRDNPPAYIRKRLYLLVRNS